MLEFLGEVSANDPRRAWTEGFEKHAKATNMKANADGVGTRSVKHGSSLKEKAAEEFREFWAIAIYLVVMFGAFTSYRRLVLSEPGVTYLHYGFAVVKALIRAKVILVGQVLRLGDDLKHRRLSEQCCSSRLYLDCFSACSRY